MSTSVPSKPAGPSPDPSMSWLPNIVVHSPEEDGDARKFTAFEPEHGGASTTTLQKQKSSSPLPTTPTMATAEDVSSFRMFVSEMLDTTSSSEPLSLTEPGISRPSPSTPPPSVQETKTVSPRRKRVDNEMLVQGFIPRVFRPLNLFMRTRPSRASTDDSDRHPFPGSSSEKRPRPTSTFFGRARATSAVVQPSYITTQHGRASTEPPENRTPGSPTSLRSRTAKTLRRFSFMELNRHYANAMDTPSSSHTAELDGSSVSTVPETPSDMHAATFSSVQSKNLLLPAFDSGLGDGLDIDTRAF